MIETAINKEKKGVTNHADGNKAPEFEWNEDEEYDATSYYEDEFQDILNDMEDAANLISEIENIKWDGHVLLSKEEFTKYCHH